MYIIYTTHMCFAKLRCFHGRKKKSKRKNINLFVSVVILKLPSG